MLIILISHLFYFCLLFCVVLPITQVHIQYHVTTIRCISTCINKEKCVQLVDLSKGSLATYFDFWKEKKNEAYSIYFVSLELILAPLNALYHFPPGLCPLGGGGG